MGLNFKKDLIIKYPEKQSSRKAGFPLIALLCCVLLSSGPGCRSSANSSREPETITSSQRIICGSPGITEIIFSLGLGDRVVGVSDFSTYPPQARNLTNIGGIFNPNRERITALRPDLIITQGKHEALAKLCREQNIRFLSPKIDSLTDIPQAIEFLGRELQAEEKAAALAQKLEKELAAIREKTQGRPKKRVFLTLGHTPGDLMGLMTTGPGTFLNELITIAGGENIFNDIAGDYPHISKEALVMRQPEIIIEVFPEGFPANNRSLLRKDWDRLATLPAVKNGNIHFLSDDYLLIPGIRIPKTAEKLARIIHPEVFE